jgi:nitrate/nitrite transporter NarK
MAEPAPRDSHPPASAFPWYLGASSLWMAGMSLQGFLFTWLLVGVLQRPADEAGLARSLAEFPPLLVLFFGGLLGDRYNGRTYLAAMHLLMAAAAAADRRRVYGLDQLGYWWVVLFGVLMASIQALSDPARQAMLNRVSRLDTQRTVTVMIITTSLVGLSGFYLGGQLDVLGLSTVLLLQAGVFFIGLFAVLKLPSLPGMQPGAVRPRLTHGLRCGLARAAGAQHHRR